MLDKTTNQTITSTKTFTKNPIITNSDGDTGVIVNHIGTSGTGVGVAVAQDSASRIELGYNPTTTDTYLWSVGATDLKIATNSTERLRLKATGIAVDNTGTPLALVGTTLCKRDNLLSSTGYAAYYPANNVTISHLVDTVIPFDTALATDSGISNSSGTFTVNTAGVYTIVATVGYLISAALGLRRSYIMINSGGLQYGQNRIIGSNAIDVFIVSSFTGKLNVGDTIKVMTMQSSGFNQTLIGYSAFVGVPTSTTLVQFTRIS